MIAQILCVTPNGICSIREVRSCNSTIATTSAIAVAVAVEVAFASAGSAADVIMVAVAVAVAVAAAGHCNQTQVMLTNMATVQHHYVNTWGPPLVL